MEDSVIISDKSSKESTKEDVEISKISLPSNIDRSNNGKRMCKWKKTEIDRLMELVRIHGFDPDQIAGSFTNKNSD